VRTVRREDLAAIDDDLVAADLGGRAQLRHRGAGLRLSHAQRDHASAAQRVRQVALLLLGRRVLDEGPDRAEITGLYDVGAARAYRRDLLDRQDRMHQGPALAAVLDGKRDAEEPLLRDHSRRLPGIFGRMRPLHGALGQLVPGETGYRVRERLVVFAELEVHLRASVD